MTLWDDYVAQLDGIHVLGVALALAFTGAVFGAAKRLGLDLQREALVAILRGAVQLAIVALVLVAVLEGGSPLVVAAVLGVMTLAAGWTAAARTKRRGVFVTATLLIGAVTFVLVAPLAHLGPFSTFPLFLIPVSGMVLGNAMNATALGLDRMDRELRMGLPLIEARLALGASGPRAVRGAVRETTRTALLPLLNTMRTTGLVHLPGTMTGMLLAGAAPVAAAEMQFVIILVLLVAAAVTSTAMAFWLRRRFLADLEAGRSDRWQVEADTARGD